MNDERTSDERFAIGEVGILTVSGNAGPKGGEVTVVGELRMIRGDWCYPVDVKNAWGLPIMVERQNLRKKRPPRDDLKLVRWDQCPWQPEKVHG